LPPTAPVARWSICRLSLIQDAQPPPYFTLAAAAGLSSATASSAFYLQGSALLMDGPRRAVADDRRDDGLIVTNNIHSSDRRIRSGKHRRTADDSRSDNSLGWILRRGLVAREWPRTAATQLDLDTPTDLHRRAAHSPEGSSARTCALTLPR
jgi:hypothetical protein